LIQEEKTLKVSVCVITYNQEKYVRQCLQSIVDQETDFDFEVIVGDDCSTDGTRTIVQEFAERYPRVVKPIFHEKNIGGHKNFYLVHQQAVGEYIAHVDGDDYCLPGKLQVQVDCLNKQSDCNIVWHAVRVIDEISGRRRDAYLPWGLYPKDGFKRGDLLAIGSVGCHSSKMYRAKCRRHLKVDFEFLDFYTDVQHIGNGKGIYIHEVFGVHRANVGISSFGNKTRQILLNNLDSLSQQFPSYRSKIGSHVFRLFVGDLIKRRSTLGLSLRLLCKVFSMKIFYDFIVTTFLLKYGKRTK